MKISCDNCGHEEYVPDDEIPGLDLGGQRCPGCGSVGLMKCAHANCFQMSCSDCGADFS